MTMDPCSPTGTGWREVNELAGRALTRDGEWLMTD